MNEMLRAKKIKNIEDVLEGVEVLIDMNFFNEFSGTKSSLFLKRILASQNTIEMDLFKKTWRTLNCTPKTLKVIRDVQENLRFMGSEKSSSQRKEQRRSAGAAELGCRSMPSTSSAAAGRSPERSTPGTTPS